MRVTFMNSGSGFLFEDAFCETKSVILRLLVQIN